ncbi:hypothetical protein L596_009882 [Steinernema carpocapsae]|uniref:Uncharacterized protein n=1 Tax=Steinernema carpocapsae TaxID=34508 RepID=A0A4U5PH57_STECR|nr:hypothetical protein L596_009882 [Steinernema carpocapsae]
MFTPGGYTTSESEGEEGASAQQECLWEIPKPESEVIMWGESAMKCREYVERIGLLKKRPVFISANCNFPGQFAPEWTMKEPRPSRTKNPGISESDQDQIMTFPQRSEVPKPQILRIQRPDSPTRFSGSPVQRPTFLAKAPSAINPSRQFPAQQDGLPNLT